MTAIRKYFRDFIAIIVLIVIAAAVSLVILQQQRLTLPGFVPFLGQNFFNFKAEFATAQALTPGQGQTVDIAGVPVGEINKVELVRGRALVSLRVKTKYRKIYPDATLLMRPKTGLKDMVIQMDPGDPASGPAIKDGDTLPISQTAPDVNLEEVLNALDSDTRAYLQLLIHSGGEGLRGQGPRVRNALKRFDPTARDLAKINGMLATRRQYIRRGVHALQEVTGAVGGKDADLARLVDSSNAVFGALAHQDVNLRRSLQLLPGSLSELRTGMAKTGVLADNLGPTLQALRPGARALGPSLRQLRPLQREATPIIRDQLRPFARATLPTVRLLRPAARSLSRATPDLTTSVKVLNYALNELGYNPPGEGKGQQGYLFYNSYVNHDGAAIFGTQDANGIIRRGLVVASCSTLGLLNGLRSVNTVDALLSLLGAPDPSNPIANGGVCPSQSGPGSGTP